ncbi:hypothetical protein WR25_13516 [Diploscapter pachys]|uniref:carbonic anhydrase n=1 Tax=Diploscapter pachys TaxID=2018661 RepID=A0A2A2JW99_9BILA|nr:hypothetical protein WR25_13516 [Diploscapter pachys]
MHHWCYDDDDTEHGPASWPTGTKQSPIDIDLACVQRVDTPDAIKFINYEHAIKGDICNNGHSVQMNPIIQCEHPEIYGGGLDQPCSEIVTWTLFTEPVGVTHEQLELFRQVEDCDCRPIRHNFRPVQALCERKVEHWVVHGHDPTHGFEAQQNHEHEHAHDN